jgi:DNA repair protein RadA/Sms
MRESKRKNPRELRACTACEKQFDASKFRCPSCGKWNVPGAGAGANDQTVLLSEIEPIPVKRMITGPWDLCFGGGIVVSSVSLIGGAPGAGKSTMSIQLCDAIAASVEREVLYIATEESKEQIKDRALRLQLKAQQLIRMHPMGSSADLGEVIMTRRPSAVIVDSLQGMTSDPELAAEYSKRFKDYAVELNAPVILIDHITKDADFAGMMSLQHNVDTTLSLFPDEEGVRELMTIKNRFGPANVAVRLEMTASGLVLALSDDEDECDD